MRLLLLLLVILFPAAATAREVHDRPALWKVADEDTTIWLFGTVHLLGPDHRWLEGPIVDAFAKADELVLETAAPPPAEAQALIIAKGSDASGKPLSRRLPPALADKLARRLAAWQLPPDIFEGVEPWYAAMLLDIVSYQKMGLDADQGAEATLIGAARRAGKPTEGIERFEEQIGFMDGLDPKLQIAMLDATLDQIDAVPTLVGSLIEAWRVGDVDRLASLINTDMDRLPRLREILLDQRNRHWADWVKQRMARPGTVFMAVGAGHLGGPANLRALLEADGFRIARVQ